MPATRTACPQITQITQNTQMTQIPNLAAPPNLLADLILPSSQGGWARVRRRCLAPLGKRDDKRGALHSHRDSTRKRSQALPTRRR